MREQEKLANAQMADARADLLFDPSTDFAERFEAVMEDLLAGRSPGQASELNINLTKDDENPTEQY